jgi:hypothetical protein
MVDIESFTWYLATKYKRVIRKNVNMEVDGSGGLAVPAEFDGTIFWNGFFLGCGGTVYGGNDESVVLFWLLLLALLVSVEFVEPESGEV